MDSFNSTAVEGAEPTIGLLRSFDRRRELLVIGIGDIRVRSLPRWKNYLCLLEQLGIHSFSRSLLPRMTQQYKHTGTSARLGVGPSRRSKINPLLLSVPSFKSSRQ